MSSGPHGIIATSHPILIGYTYHIGIRGAIARRKLKRVDRIVPVFWKTDC